MSVWQGVTGRGQDCLRRGETIRAGARMFASRSTGVQMTWCEAIHDGCAGEEAAFSEIFAFFRPRVLRTIRSVVRRSEDVEDVLQEVFLRMFVSRERLRSIQFPDAWVRRLTINTVYDYLRKLRLIPEVLMADLADGQTWRTAEGAAFGVRQYDECHQVESRVDAGALLSRIPQADRELLLLREVNGYSVRELACTLSLKENAIAVRLFRARSRARHAGARLAPSSGLTPRPTTAALGKVHSQLATKK